MDIVLDRSLFAGITPLTPEQGEDRGTSAETGAMLLLPHFPLFSNSHKARRPQLLCEVDNNGDEYGADDDDDTGRYSGYMRDNNNDEVDDEDNNGGYRYSGYGGCSESESEWADDRDGWSDR